MTQRITRKDLKRNELAETMTKTVDYVAQHRRGVTEAIVIAVAAAVLIAGVIVFRIYRANAAGEELSAALEILATPIAGQSTAAQSAKTYPSAAERDKAAEPHLRKAASHSGSPAGQAAAVILAARDPQAENAVEVLSRVARDGKAEVAAAAEIGAARVLASKGKTTEATERLKRAIESSDASAPKDALLFAMGEIYEKAGLSTDAKAAFQRIVSDYPKSAYRSDAQAKLPGAAASPQGFNPS